MNGFPRWMIIAHVAALLGLVAGGAWFYHRQALSVQGAAEAQLASIGQLKADQIAAWRAERLADAAVLTESPFLAQAVARFLADAREDNAQSLLVRFRSLQANYNYANILLVNPQGRVLLNLDRAVELQEECKTFLAAALHERKPILTELFTGGSMPSPHLGVMAPIFDGERLDGPPLGAIIMVCDASRFLYPLIQSWPTPSKSAETLLIRRDGQDALFLNDLRHQKDTALKLRIPLSRSEWPAVMGRQGAFHGKDYRGVEVVSVILPIQDSNWFIVAKQDRTEIFAEWRWRAALILLVFMILAGGWAAMVLVAWQRRKEVYFKSLFQAETKLRESEQKSQLKKIESLARVAGGIAHHYNNLMTVIMGNLEMAQLELPRLSGPTEELAAAMKAARRASALAATMLTYLGQGVIQRRPLDLCQSCRGFLPELLTGLPAYVTLVSDLPEPGPTVLADAGQILQMLRSLITNAWEAMGEKPGRISLTVGNASAADISTAYRRPVEFQSTAAGYACIEVKDSGCGIAAKEFEKLFDPFYSTKFTGRGLGLSMVLGAVKVHEGCITLESEPGVGSSFKIFLPLNPKADHPIK
ncbi:MAG: ATP-binding protein [Desulfobacteraceae bacterium]|nr:ATP-binding protein [Desulfobacteraceae bacterium]